MVAARGLVIIAVACLLCVNGCDCGGGGTASSGGSGGSQQSNEANDPTKPLMGKGASSASQLVGTWHEITDGEFVGFEFLKDGKAIITHAMAPAGGSAATTVNYSVLDGGRLSLATATGQTMLFETVLSGDVLEIKGQASFGGAGSQRFRRLKAGQTLAQAAQEKRQAEAKAFEDRLVALREFLKQPGLVLGATQPGAGAPPTMALELPQNDGTNFSGRAWHDDSPPRLNAISGQVSINQFEKQAQIHVRFGQRIAPPTAAADGGGQITLTVSGAGKDLKAAGKVRYGNGPEVELVLRPDAAPHSEVVKRFDAEIARIEALKQNLLGAVKDYAQLRGKAKNGNQPEMDEVQLTLVRVAGTQTYRGEGTFVNGRTGIGEVLTGVAAAVLMEGQKPVLKIASQTKHFTLGTKGDAKDKLWGTWAPSAYAAGLNVDFDVVRAMDAKGLAEEFVAQKAVLAKLPADTGFVCPSYDTPQPQEASVPMHLTVSPGPNGAFSGKASFPTVQVVMTLAGQVQDTPMGPRLVMRYTARQTSPRPASPVFAGSIQNDAIVIGLTEAASPGKVVAQRVVNNVARPMVLEPGGKERGAELRKKIASVLAKPARYTLIKPATAGQEPTVFEMKLDEATNAVAVTRVSGGRILLAAANSTHEGKLIEEDGWTTLLIIQKTPGKPSATHRDELFAFEAADGVHFVGPHIGSKPDGSPLADFNPRQMLEFAPAKP